MGHALGIGGASQASAMQQHVSWLLLLLLLTTTLTALATSAKGPLLAAGTHRSVVERGLLLGGCWQRLVCSTQQLSIQEV